MSKLLILGISLLLTGLTVLGILVTNSNGTWPPEPLGLLAIGLLAIGSSTIIINLIQR